MNPSSFPLPAAETQRSSAFRTLTALARAHPGRLAVTLGLVALENVLMLAYPLFAGFAVDAILRGDTAHALWYAVVVLAFWLVGAARRAVDTRTFTRLYAELAVGVVLAQRQQAQSTSTAAARVVLAREFVDFFEHHAQPLEHRAPALVGQERPQHVLGLGADDGVDDRTVAHHEQQRGAGSSTKRHTNAELARPLPRGERQHAISANRTQEQRG